MGKKSAKRQSQTKADRLRQMKKEESLTLGLFLVSITLSWYPCGQFIQFVVLQQIKQFFQR